MKKMLFGLIATVLIGVNGNAQVKLTKENVREEMAKGMVSFTNSLKPAAEKSTDLKSFKQLLVGKYSTRVSVEGNQLLDKAYNYIVKNISDEEILSTDSGKEMAQATLFIHKNSPKGTVDPKVVFGGTTGDFNPQNTTSRCSWWQLDCHLASVFGPKGGAAILDAIVEIIIFFIKN